MRLQGPIHGPTSGFTKRRTISGRANRGRSGTGRSGGHGGNHRNGGAVVKLEDEEGRGHGGTTKGGGATGGACGDARGASERGNDTPAGGSSSPGPLHSLLS